MNLLSLDTSTLTGSAAVVSDGVVLAESTARVRATQSEQILPLVDEVLARAGLTLDRIDRIAVGIGPGSFTGVRIALATAKGLHLATGAALYGVRSLDALASSLWGAQGLVLAALDARRGETYAALYRLDGNERETVLAPFHGSPASVGEAVRAFDGPIAVVGDLGADDLRALTGDDRRFALAPAVLATPLARFVAYEVLADRGTLDEGALEPLYVRGSDAKLPGGKTVAP